MAAALAQWVLTLLAAVQVVLAQRHLFLARLLPMLAVAVAAMQRVHRVVFPAHRAVQAEAEAVAVAPPKGLELLVLLTRAAEAEAEAMALKRFLEQVVLEL